MKKCYLRRVLPRQRFARNVAILAGCAAAGQAIAVLASPMLTRLYTLADFGVRVVFASTLGILTIIASLHYLLAIPLSADDEESASLLALSLFVVFRTAALQAKAP